LVSRFWVSSYGAFVEKGLLAKDLTAQVCTVQKKQALGAVEGRKLRVVTALRLFRASIVGAVDDQWRGDSQCRHSA
jgi:hypothetical protein